MEYIFQTLYLCPVDKKTQIILAAMELLIEHGVQATPMSAIAKKAGSGMGTIYNYFTTKEELINAIYLYIKGNEMKTMAVPFADDSIKRRFDHYYGTFTTYMVENPAHFIFMDQFHNSPILTQETKDEGMKVIAPLIELLAKGQRQGIIKDISIDELLQFLNGGLMGFVRWMLDSGKKLDKKLLQNQLRIAWDAVKQ